MGTISGEITLSFTYLLPFSRGVYSLRKERAPCEENSFLQSKSQFGIVMSDREINTKPRKLFPVVKMTGKHGGVPVVPYTFKTQFGKFLLLRQPRSETLVY